MSISAINHTQIPNEFIDNMHILSPSAITVFLAVCRKTIGWHKDTDVISEGQLSEITGISSRNTIRTAIKELVEKDFIVVSRTGIGKATKTHFEINYGSKNEPIKNFNSLKNEPKKTINGSKIDLLSQNNGSKIDHTKESLNINKKYKEIYSASSDDDTPTLFKNQHNHLEKQQKPIPKKTETQEKDGTHPVMTTKDVIAMFCEKWKEQTGYSYYVTKADAGNAGDLLKFIFQQCSQRTYEAQKAFFANILNNAFSDKWFVENGHLATLYTLVNKYRKERPPEFTADDKRILQIKGWKQDAEGYRKLQEYYIESRERTRLMWERQEQRDREQEQREKESEENHGRTH